MRLGVCPVSMLRTRAGHSRAETALKHANRRCPFLKRNPGVLGSEANARSDRSADNHNHAPVHPDALKVIAAKCPVMAPVIHSPVHKLSQASVKDAAIKTAHTELMMSTGVKGHSACPSLDVPLQCPVTNAIQHPTAAKCPFAHSEEEGNHEESNAVPRPYDYAQKFSSMIDRKKNDASYRVFTTIERDVTTYPVSTRYNTLHRDSPAADLCSTSSGPLTQAQNVDTWCSNDYLAMSMHPDVVQTVIDVSLREGIGSGGTRNISGNHTHHERLERQLAELHDKEAALVFTSCFVANDATLSTLGSLLPGCIIYSDESNHASMIQGIRNGRCEKRIFRHNDPGHLDELMKMDSPAAPKIVAFESVYSMCGTIAPIEELCDVAQKHNALTFIDEVHAVGLYGKSGAGIAERDGLQSSVDIVSGTLAKAYGTLGGYIAGPRDLVDTVRSYAPGFVFTSSLPPIVAAAASKSIDLLRGDVGLDLRQQHQANSERMIDMLRAAGIPVLPTESHIVPILVGDAEICKSISDALIQNYNIYVQPINFPTVPRNAERLRVTPGPYHTYDMMDRFVNSLCEVWSAHGLEFLSPCQSDREDISAISLF